MRTRLAVSSGLTALVASLIAMPAPPQASASVDPAAAMHWRHIGPTRAGRTRAVAGVASQPNVAYIGFDNGGLWRSTDYGSNWVPLFDRESTGSIGAIAVAPSDPNIIYVGTGAGIIRPDLATGNGVYKSIDAGKTCADRLANPIFLGDDHGVRKPKVQALEDSDLFPLLGFLCRSQLRDDSAAGSAHW